MEKVMNQRVMLTKTLLKNSLIQLLKEKNIYSISIRELCDTAGMNRSTFYKYYGNQYELLAEVEDELLANIKSYLFNSTNGKPNYSDNALISVLQFFEKNIDLCKLLINNNVDPDFYDTLFNILPVEFALQQELQDVYPVNEQGYVTSFIFQGCFQIIKEWINKEDREPAKKIAEIIIKLNGKIIPVS